ncbi:hypothetical protein [Burkholderia diffusa]|uniref:hypothetical protein n=1 Tax=Burkholderia diffusa TaxID=488732 RepID=UPI002ABDDF58|nr:hypothetical protein [Burkholderia diffusa]
MAASARGGRMAMWVDVRGPAGVTLIRIGFLVVVLSARHPGRSKARRHVRRVFHWIRRATPARRSTRDLHGIDREIRERVMRAAGPERRPAAMKDGDAVAHGHSGARVNGGMAAAEFSQWLAATREPARAAVAAPRPGLHVALPGHTRLTDVDASTEGTPAP